MEINIAELEMKCRRVLVIISIVCTALASVSESNTAAMNIVGHGYRLTSITKNCKGNLFGDMELIMGTQTYGQDIKKLQLFVR